YAKEGDRVLITGDLRNHTPILRYAMVLGIASVGVEVDYAEDFLTSGAHNLLSTENPGNHKFMVQVSGSHGPPEKNGFKIKVDLGNGILEPLYEEKLENLYKTRHHVRTDVQTANITVVTGLNKWVVNMLDETLPPIDMNEIVVIDSRAGTAGPIITELLKKRHFTIIDMDRISEEKVVSQIHKLWRSGSRRIAVMLNMTPDANMGRGIWDPSKPEALKPTQKLIKIINANLLEDMPNAIGAVFDGDVDRIAAILEDGKDVPAFEMTLPYYQRFLLHPDNQEVIIRLAKAGAKPIKIVCDVRANTKLLNLIDRVNSELQEKSGIKDRNIIEGWFITTGYPPQLSFMINRTGELDEFVNSHAALRKDNDFMRKFGHLKNTYFTAEASGHNFFHISSKYPERVCDCAISGLVTLLNIKETMSKYEVPILGLAEGTTDLTDLFDNFPVAYSSREVTIPIPNDIKISTAHEIGAWMKKRFEGELKPYGKARKEAEYLVQPKEEGYVTVSGYKIQLMDGRTALVRWSNTSEKLTTIFEGYDLPSLISIIEIITERLRQEEVNGVDVSTLDEEIRRLKNIQEAQGAAVIAQRLHVPLDSHGNKNMAARFLKGGYKQDGYGVAEKAAIDGSFAIGKEGNQGYYVEGGKETFLNTVKSMKDFFRRRAERLGKPIRYVIKPGIGGQHTPFQGIAALFQVIDAERRIIVGEYELGKDYEVSLTKVLNELGADWDQIVVIPSSKSGSTDETMMVFVDILCALLKNIAEMQIKGIDGKEFVNVVLDTVHEVNFRDGKERPGKDLFKGFSLSLVQENLNNSGLNVTYEQVKEVFGKVLGNMFFETTDRPEASRLSAFIRNSNLDKELGRDAPGFGAMYDNVGGRWTADLHMMTFLAYYGLNAESYWNARYKGIVEVREGRHAGNEIGNKILNEGITDIALVVPDEFFWFGKSIEQNFNESIWQQGFANLIAIKQSKWDTQKHHYARQMDRLVINLSSLAIPQISFNVFKLDVPDFSRLSKQETANAFAELFTTFYAMANTVGNRLITRAIVETDYKVTEVDQNDLDNPATQIMQQNLYLRQAYVELGKGLLERRLGELQNAETGTKGIILAQLEEIKRAAKEGQLKAYVPGLEFPERIQDMETLADVIRRISEYARQNNRKFVPFVYLEGEKFYTLRDYLIDLGIEWVMQGTGDQHISYQQVLAQPQKYLPFVISFIPEKTLAGKPAIGFAKGYL
ncbi:MAG: hypothetical protein KAU58_00675, partial [Candidatus Omnitrophica bacterium]|nr:hypothetical protein [Candidatus Omnitrophota bacterium]